MLTADSHPTVLWELTRLCDLHYLGCPSGANEQRDPNELSTYEAYKTIDQIAALRPRELIISGGDPLERDDVDQIIDYARRRGLDPSLVLTPSPDLTFDAIAKLQNNGLTSAVFSIDGSTAATHESMHGVRGTFARTLRAMRWAGRVGLRVEVNTLVTRHNANDLEAIVELIRPFSITRWNVHFIVPVGASRDLAMITASEVEQVFATLDRIRARETFAVRAVEAPHYRRFRVQQILLSRLAADGVEWGDFTGYADEDVSSREILDAALDGARSFVYISHSGEVRPSELAPHSAGNLRYRPLGDIYRGSDLFVALRDPENLHGRCWQCDYRMLCGGSRARAYAMTGDLFGADPLCAYEPNRDAAMPLVSHGREVST
ncbi:MAG: AdoMet-dependent heme synthase [Acidobacteriota bacterium]|jgi:radical SAM protein with 4Fe4S-binding SPASM domain|nr:AdoMet-dependent heme synthase [Acidobacteriota bacterium]